MIFRAWIILTVFSLMVLVPQIVTARIVGVTALSDVPGKIVSAPPEAVDSAIASSRHMLGFDERQNVLLTGDIEVDGGLVRKGTRVDSHMILYNVPDTEAFGSFADNEWVFSGTVIGVMSDMDGRLEAASSAALGAPGTSYPPDGFFLRGFEENDGYDGVGTTRLRVWMSVWQPGDWIRVITLPGPIAVGPTPKTPRARIARDRDRKPSAGIEGRFGHGASR